MKKISQIRIWKVIEDNIKNNKRDYIIVTIIFLIGLFCGIMFINNTKQSQVNEITDYINNFNQKLKNSEKLEYGVMLQNSIKQNLLTGILIWFFGTTVIGIPVVIGLILYRGFCLGYSISSVVLSLGIGKGIAFILVSMLLQNMIFIPSIIAIAVSGMKLYRTIVKDKRNIKSEVLRHTIFSAIILLAISLSSVVEVFISTNGLKKISKYF